MSGHSDRTYGFRETFRTSCLVSLLVIPFCWSCGGTKESGVQITLTEYERLHDIEEELPLPPDSNAARYQHFDSTAFRVVYHDKLFATTASTFNLMNNRLEELEAPMKYIDLRHVTVIRRLIEISGTTR